jgi:thiol-disulfide isomerase/thioredoxin
LSLHYPTPTVGPLDVQSGEGHFILVHFFATWCEPCREELAALNRFALRARGTMNVAAISVAEADRAVQRYFYAKPVSFPVLLDRERAVSKS